MKYDVISYRFNLPILLALPKSSFRVVLDGDQACFIIIRGGAIGKKEFATDVAVSKNIVWDSPDTLIMIGSVIEADGKETDALEVLSDKGGTPYRTRTAQSYTEIEMILEVPYGQDVEVYKEPGRHLILKTLSRFLLGYRSFANDNYVPDLNWMDIAVIGIRTGAGERLSDTDYKYEISDKNLPFIQMEDMARHIKKSLPEEKVNALASWVTSGMQLEEYDHLLLVSTERAIYHKDYIASAIFCQTAFEVFVSGFVRNRALTAGKSQLPVVSKVLKPVVQALEESGVKYILKILLPLVSGTSIAGGKEYNDWNTDAYKLRNEIVHAGRSNVNMTDVKKAFESVSALIAKIKSIP